MRIDISPVSGDVMSTGGEVRRLADVEIGTGGETPPVMTEFSLAGLGPVNLSFYNANGQLIRVLIETSRPAGNHQVVWDGIDNGGTAVSSGVYFYRMKARDYDRSMKMILLR